MIGTVEIYKKYGTAEQELVHKESNLIVNGGGEAICDLLTMPSGVASALPEQGASLTDSSNFTVQAISFGKSSESYRNNAHFYPFNLSSYVGVGKYESYIQLVKADKVIRAVSMLDENITATVHSYDPKRDPGATPNVNDTQLEPDTRCAIDLVSGQYHSMGNKLMQGRAHSVGHSLNRVQSHTNPNLLSYTEDPNADPNAGSTPDMTNQVVWTSSTGVAKITLLDESNTSFYSGPFSNTSSILVSGTGAAVAVLRQENPLQKTYFHPNLDHTFSLYAKLPEVNSASSLQLNISDQTGTTKSHSVTFSFSGIDTSTISPPTIVHQINGASGNITPSAGVDGSGGWYRLECRLENLGKSTAPELADHLTVRAIIGKHALFTDLPAAIEFYGWQLEESAVATPYKVVRGLNLTNNEIGGDLFLGCFPPTKQADFAIVSSIANLTTPQSNIYVSGTYPTSSTGHYFNSSGIRSMDRNGYVKALYELHGDAYTTNDPVSGLVVSASHVAPGGTCDFSSTGEVTYVCTISSGDLGYSNMYGGLFKVGLWTIDLPKTLAAVDSEGNPKGIPTFPLRFTAGYNKLVYKLFAEKSFNKNLAAIKDSGSDDGCTAYEDLTLIWKIKFTGGDLTA